MIDTHAHLHMHHFDPDREAVLARDFVLGITGILEASVSRESWPLMSWIAGDPRIALAAGVHPHEARHWQPGYPERVLSHGSVVAIGEVGLDAVKTYSPREDQLRVFSYQVQMAVEADLPLVLHCREAFDDLFRILEETGRGRLRGVFHCFSGTGVHLERALAMGSYIGVSGSVTLPRSHVHRLLRRIPAERLLLETDAPYLAPAPERGKRNEPAFIFHTLKAVARALGMEESRLEQMVDSNARALFRWDPPRSTGQVHRTGRL